MVCQLFSSPQGAGSVPGGMAFDHTALEALADQAGIEIAELNDHELSFVTQGGEQIIPMDAAERLARSLVTREPSSIAETIIDWEQREPDAHYYQQALRTIRRWASVPDTPAAEEIAETVGVRRAALEAIERLETVAAEANAAAKELRQKLDL